MSIKALKARLDSLSSNNLTDDFELALARATGKHQSHGERVAFTKLVRLCSQDGGEYA